MQASLSNEFLILTVDTLGAAAVCLAPGKGQTTLSTTVER